jgi:hypothetical protein
MGRQKVIKRKSESAHTRRHRGRQKERRPTVEPFPATNPKITTNPEPMPMKLITTCTKVNVDVVMPRIMISVLSESRVSYFVSELSYSLREEPPPALSLIDPVLDQASRRYVVVLIANLMCEAQGSCQVLVVGQGVPPAFAPKIRALHPCLSGTGVVKCS